MPIVADYKVVYNGSLQVGTEDGDATVDFDLPDGAQLTDGGQRPLLTVTVGVGYQKPADGVELSLVLIADLNGNSVPGGTFSGASGQFSITRPIDGSAFVRAGNTLSFRIAAADGTDPPGYLSILTVVIHFQRRVAASEFEDLSDLPRVLR